MARIRVTYNSYPDCPEATEYSRQRAVSGSYLEYIFSFGTLATVVYFVSTVINLFSEANWGDYATAWGVLIAVALVDLYLVLRSMITDRECKIIIAKHQFASLSSQERSEIISRLTSLSKEDMKRKSQNYVLYFFGGSLCVTGIVGFISGINFLCHGHSGALLLLGSLIGTVIIILLTIYLSKRINGTANTSQAPTNGTPFVPSNTGNFSNLGIGIMEQPKTASYSLQKASKTIFYIGIIIFLILYIKIAPGFGWEKYASYAAGATVVILVAVMLNKRAQKLSTKGTYMAMLLFSVCLMLFSASLRIMYEAKIDRALAAIPDSGMVHVKLTYEDEYYNDTGTGFVNDPKPDIYIGQDIINSGGIRELELNTNVNVNGSSYYYHDGMQYSGNGSQTINLTADNLKNGYKFDIYFSTGGGENCNLAVTATYVMGFWDVILYE